ncbi:metalloregulator ArsR/SmtB family transcription factor [Haladaptatus sp. DJG-WS-42]|uniref:ArsR/SmtB family transcription factor n=1 Tax=Haladaptatus sp. DJG-WS-42 TaxID=3120516 RepID=UPI0030CE2218
MDSAALLDLLGNENRRRILRLLARKPCYVTEISEYLGVSPKAVIDHLRKLEDAGLVESRTDDQRRKYFHIARNLRLEVNVSPYSFGTKSAYPASSSLDMTTTCRHLTLDVKTASTNSDTSVEEVVSELASLEQLESELSMAQRWVQGRLTDVMDRLSEYVGDANARLFTDILRAIAGGADTVAKIATVVEAPYAIVEDSLYQLNERGLVYFENGRWKIAD